MPVLKTNSLRVALCCYGRWNQCCSEAGQHSCGTDPLEASQQPILGPEVYAGTWPGNAWEIA